jgi:hypothetical protein
LDLFPLYEKIAEYRDKQKIHLQQMEQTRIPLQAYKYYLSMVIKTWEDQEEGGRRHDSIKGWNRQFI